MISNSDTAIELRLQSFIQRIERLITERDAINTDIGEVYKEAKGTGLDAKIMRKVVALRKMDEAERQEMDHLLALYRKAAGV